MTASRVLVCGPEPDRSGAPLALLRQMRWLAAEGIIDPVFAFRARGELLADFRSIGPTLVWSDLVERVGLRGARVVGREDVVRSVQRRALAAWLERRCRDLRIDLVYVNTVRSWEMVLGARDVGLPAVWHVHESARAISSYVPPAAMRQTVAAATRFIAVSAPVARALEAYGAEPSRTSVIPGIVAPGLPPGRPGPTPAGHRTVGGNGGLVVGAGKPSETKGSDLFVQLAADLVRRRPEARFRWVGLRDGPASAAMRSEVRAAGLDRAVELVDAVPDPWRYLSTGDVFVSTAREDSMPLTVLEAAAAGVPFVCFDGAGGASDVARLGAGLTADYLDVRAMADTVDQLLTDDRLRSQLSARARQLVAETCSEGVAGSAAAAVIAAALGV